jgi:hypothetical protein
LLGARLAQKGGATQAGILFLANMHESTDDKDARKDIEMRIEALKGVLVIEKAIETFTDKFNREPDALEELITEGILESLPINPYLKEYQYKDGQVEF